MAHFQWSCSYLGDVFYKVHGVQGIYEVRVHNQDARTLAYYQGIFNHNGDPTSFYRNVVSAVGGADLHGHRWTPELWHAFIEFLGLKHEDYLRWHEARVYLESPPNPRDPAPRPIFWNGVQFETEPWHVESAKAA